MRNMELNQDTLLGQKERAVVSLLATGLREFDAFKIVTRLWDEYPMAANYGIGRAIGILTTEVIGETRHTSASWLEYIIDQSLAAAKQCANLEVETLVNTNRP